MPARRSRKKIPKSAAISRNGLPAISDRKGIGTPVATISAIMTPAMISPIDTD